MTQEEKAKRYDKAIEQLRKMMPNWDKLSYNGKTFLQDLVYIIPELKESEDERIREALIQYVKNWIAQGKNRGCVFHTWTSDEKECNEILAWLEKQGEHSNFLSKIQVGDKVTRNEDGVLVNLSQLKRIAKPAEEHNITGIGSKSAQGKLGEMIKNLKPVNLVLELDSAWSEKYIADVFEKVGLAKIAREQSNDSLTNALQDAMIELSKFTPQPKQEWSEEDKDYYDAIIAKLEVTQDDALLTDNQMEFLKSLKDRYTWKPSDEHYELEEFAKIVRGNLTGISKAVQKLFEAKYLQLTGNKMYGGFKD